MIAQANSFRIPMKDNSIHCCISSFPYYGLRSYDLPPIIIGGRADCRHVWGGSKVVKNTPQRDHNGANGFADSRGTESHRAGTIQEFETGQLCALCGAFLGSFGLEPTISLHVQNAVLVCREIKRVLRPDGVFWLNYGDSYSTARNGRSAADGKAAGNDDRTFRDKPFTVDELPAKNLCLVPERIIIALQEDGAASPGQMRLAERLINAITASYDSRDEWPDRIRNEVEALEREWQDAQRGGWIVRSVASWIKKNPMPESVKDRPGTAHEYVFMLVKSERYYFDMESVRRGISQSTVERWNGIHPRKNASKQGFEVGSVQGESTMGINPSGRALRTSDFFFDSIDATIAHLEAIRDKGGMMVNEDGLPAAFVVNPKGYAGAHYATYPLELVSPMIKASTSERGCCPKCGAQWIRETESDYVKHRPSGGKTSRIERGNRIHDGGAGNWGTFGTNLRKVTQTLGWRPSCACLDRAIEAEWLRRGDETLQARIQIEAELTPQFEPTPAIVFDPFCGSGATLAAANELGRRGIGLDLNPTYLAENALPRAEKKMSQKSLGQLPLFKAA